MRPILNIIWFFFSGFWLAISYAFAGIVLCLAIITFPAGMMCFRIAGYVVWPFGRYVVEKSSAGTGSFLLNVLWIITIGAWLTIWHIITAVALAVTIIGLPMAWANLKLIPLALMPFGKMVISGRNPDFPIR
ncbi:YccF domain-containing protein [Actinomycetaceae bacterium TAE3-ERU4]|nr:YccF domain-containing protein [Actinomycetaceae bacterium TAE3-ERU4]